LTHKQIPLAEAKMKTWIMTTSIPKQAKKLLADGTDVETCNAMVSGKTKKDIIENFRLAGIECSPYLLKEYGSDVTDVYPYNRMAIEGVVQVQRLNNNSAPWFALSSLETESHIPTVQYPAGTPEYERFRDELQVELGKFVRYEAPYYLRDEVMGYPV
jgi:hypothetical protein